MACNRCGTAFMAEAIRLWPPKPEGGKGNGKGKGKEERGVGAVRGQGKGGGGAGAATPGRGGCHPLQGGYTGAGAATSSPTGGPRSVGPQAQQRYPLQGRGWGGKGGGTGNGVVPNQARRAPSTKVEEMEETLARLVAVVGEDDAYVADYRRRLDKARAEEEASLSPADKVTRLRAELSKAQVVLVTTIKEVGDLDEEKERIRTKIEETEERAQEQQIGIMELKRNIAEQELQANLSQPTASGSTVDQSLEAKHYRQCEEMVSTYIAAVTSRRGSPPKDEELKAYKEAVFGSHSMACEAMLPPVPDESMEPAEPDERASKASKTPKWSDEEIREDTRLREGLDVDMSDEDEIAKGWQQHGSNKAVERLLRKLQIGNDEAAANSYAKLAAKKVRAKAKATPSPKEQSSSAAPCTPVPTSFDDRRWSTRRRGEVDERDIVFPPLPTPGGRAADLRPMGAGTPGTGSSSGQLLGASAASSAAPAGIAPPAQGTQSPTGGPSGGAAGDVRSPAASAPPAEGPGNGGGGGLCSMSVYCSRL